MRHRVKRSSLSGNGHDPAIQIAGPIRASDMVLFIREGMANVRTPEHDGGQVPEDFVVLLGVATAWHDDRFRAMMKAIVRDHAPNGLYAGIIS